jgi:HEAT repeat protein
MRARNSLLLLALVACGCGKSKSTEQLLADLKGNSERDRLIAVRLLPQRQEDAAEVVPGLIEALQDRDGDIRRSAALGLGSFGEQAREAIPALQGVLDDRDGRVREAAKLALTRIDPILAPKAPSKAPPGQ